MRKHVVWSALCLALLAGLTGCGKSNRAEQQPPIEIEGVKVDAPSLAVEFLDAPPQVSKPVNDAVTSLRYKRYPEAMMALEEALKSPGLSDKQKKLITKVQDQLKEVVSKTPVPGQ